MFPSAWFCAHFQFEETRKKLNQCLINNNKKKMKYCKKGFYLGDRKASITKTLNAVKADRNTCQYFCSILNKALLTSTPTESHENKV